ncbi:MAG TPA: amidohydrolase family protein [Planctomycetaceae bacterium]|nr:amidohydrolase family protein [Planctomycetaceae bacterium]
MPAEPRSTGPASVDVHTHVFCWGENPDEGFVSERVRRGWLTRLLLALTRIRSEEGETLSAKIRNRLLRHVNASKLDHVVVLAQDAVYRADGSRDDAATHFYVSNDYVLGLADESSRILPGCSINPVRRDALHELERCHSAGARLVKVHTAIQGVDPSRTEFDPFYRLARELGVVLMFHTGYEHSCPVISQKYTDPRLLARPLDHGGTVIAAHCGTCAFFDPEDYYPRFIEMLGRHDNLYGDTAIMASLVRWNSLRRLEREPPAVRDRIVHGSDYPFPPARLPHLFRTGLRPRERSNPLDLDLKIKLAYDCGPRYTSRALEWLGAAGGTRD